MAREFQRIAIGAVSIILAVIVSGYILSSNLGIDTSLFVIMTIFFVILFALVTGASSAMVKGTPTHLFAAKARDPSVLQRVVLDTIVRQEHIISGAPSQSFRSACKDNWIFQSISANDGWIIQDARGNDISAIPLSEYHGIAKLVSTEHAQSSRSSYETEEEETDKSDEYSDMERGVTFYD